METKVIQKTSITKEYFFVSRLEKQTKTNKKVLLLIFGCSGQGTKRRILRPSDWTHTKFLDGASTAGEPKMKIHMCSIEENDE